MFSNLKPLLFWVRTVREGACASIGVLAYPTPQPAITTTDFITLYELCMARAVSEHVLPSATRPVTKTSLSSVASSAILKRFHLGQEMSPLLQWTQLNHLHCCKTSSNLLAATALTGLNTLPPRLPRRQHCQPHITNSTVSIFTFSTTGSEDQKMGLRG